MYTPLTPLCPRCWRRVSVPGDGRLSNHDAICHGRLSLMLAVNCHSSASRSQFITLSPPVIMFMCALSGGFLVFCFIAGPDISFRRLFCMTCERERERERERETGGQGRGLQRQRQGDRDRQREGVGQTFIDSSDVSYFGMIASLYQQQEST